MHKKLTYGTLILLLLIYILSFVDRQIVAVLGVAIRDSLQLSNVQIGLLYGPAFSFVYALSGIPMGRLADRISRKMMICGGLFIWSLMTVLSGFAASFTFLVTARLFVGLSQAMLSPAVYSYLADAYSPGQRATVFSVYASGIFIGIGLSFLGGGTLAIYYDWRVAMIAAGIPGLVLAPIAWQILKEPSRLGKWKMPESNLFQTLRRITRKRAVQWHLTGFAALACTGYTILGFIGNLFSDLHQSPEYIAKFGFFMFGVALTVVLSGRAADLLARKNPSRRFYAGTFAALGGLPFYITGLLSSQPQMAFWCMGIGVLISSSYNGVGAALLQYFVKSSERALAGGLYLFVISIAGFGVGPPLAGWLTDSVWSGEDAIAKSMLTIILICSLIAVYSFRKAMKWYHHDAESDPDTVHVDL
ncbi:MAG: MFS transporter [Balneolaceae bacterium]|nr:MAG: MFS transporter [Balneolaceae bacterium]